MHQISGIFLAMCEDLDTPRSLTASLLWRAGEYDQLVDLTVDPMHYLDYQSEKFWADNLCSEFLRKADFLPLNRDRRTEAVKLWFQAEHSCARTNLRLASFIHNHFEDGVDERLVAIVARCKELLSDWLGPLPADIAGRFGPGATLSDKARSTSVASKIVSIPTSTSRAQFLHQSFWWPTLWGREQCAAGGLNPALSRGNRFTTVPKDARKDRGISIEPSVNVFLQLGVGSAIRRRLKRVGIDLDLNQDLHTRLAAAGSLDGSLATIDLSMASDTVAKSLPRLLLPPLWLDLLESLRSPTTEVDGKVYHLEKFSSMGNGFTFELETILFLALSCAVTGLSPGDGVWVYGDDIIVPSAHSADVLACLAYFGFTPNRRKTFTTGLFRESCGGDFFKGRGVRATYLKELPATPADWFALLNGLRRTCLDFPGRWQSLRRAWFRALSHVPSPLRSCRGPQALGDAVIHDSPEFWTVKTRDSIRYVRGLVSEPRTISLYRFSWGAAKAAVIYGTSPSPTIRFDRSLSKGGRIPVRGDPVGYRVKWFPWS